VARAEVTVHDQARAVLVEQRLQFGDAAVDLAFGDVARHHLRIRVRSSGRRLAKLDGQA